MSQMTEAEVNGPTDVGPRPGPYEGVKVPPGSNSPPQPTLQGPPVTQQGYYQPSVQNQQFSNVNQRPPAAVPAQIRRADSRSSISYRPPFPNQPVGQVPVNTAVRPPPQQLSPRAPPPSGSYAPPSPRPRFPPPGQVAPPQGEPIRYQYVPQNQEGNFRRAVNAAVYQRPPNSVPRAPLYTQKSLPQQQTIPQEVIKKSYTLDNSEVQLAHSDDQNGAKKLDLINTDIRSSSSLGFTQETNGEKDIDTTLNGKSASREDIERPESRTGFLSRDHSSHSSMLKIDEDDDDAVVTPARTYMRSGKSSMSNSSDNISQKSLDLNKPDATKPKLTTPPKRNSNDNISLKSLDIDPQIVRASSPLPPEDVKKPVSPLPPPNRLTPDPIKTLIPQEKISRSPSPNPPMKQPEPPRSATPEQQRPMSAGVKPMTPTSPMARESPTSLTPSARTAASPRIEQKSLLSGRKTPSGRIRKEGDNDSGVDESTQGNDRSLNGEQSSPRKTPSKVSSSKLPTNKCKTPTKMLQSPKSPDPSNSLPPSADKKKLPMNKVQVGAAPSPNIKQVRSKIGSLENTSYKPGGGKVKVENRKIDFSKVQPKIAAKNEQYTPGGGEKKIQQQKLQWTAKSKIGSLDNTTYRPGGGDKKIETVKLDFKDKAKPKVGSKDNIKHQPGGGDVKSVSEELLKEIETKKIELNAASKVGSLDNVKHRPGGGDIKIFDDKDYLRQKTPGEISALSGSQDLYYEMEAPEAPLPVSKRRQNAKPPTTLNIASPSPRRRVRYLDLHGPQSLVDSPQPKSIDYQRPMSACSNFARKKYKTKVSFSIMDRPPWRY